MKEVTKSSFKVLKHLSSYIILLIVLIIVCLFVKYNYMDSINLFDKNVLEYIQLNFVNDTNTKIMKTITEFGSAWILVPLVLIILIAFKKKTYGLLASINLLFVFLINNILKTIYARPRPEVEIIKETSFSFPSSHVMCSVVFYGFLAILINQHIKKKWLKALVIVFFSLLVLLIAFSRMYLHVHYLTDVLFGFIFGFICLAIFVSIIKFMKKEN